MSPQQRVPVHPRAACPHCGGDLQVPQLKGMEVIVWTSVEQELPDSDLTVMITLVPGSDEPAWLGYHDGEKWRDVDGLVVEVTYWAHMVCGGPQ